MIYTEFDESKRNFVKMLLLGIGATAGLQGCALFPVSYGKDREIIIDAHAHIFNSRDFEQLAVLVYVYKVLFSEKIPLNDFLDGVFTDVGTATGRVVESIFERLTPSYAEENEMLEKRLAAIPGYDSLRTLSSNINSDSAGFIDRPGNKLKIDNEDELTTQDYLNAYYVARDEVLDASPQFIDSEDSLEASIETIRAYIEYRKRRKLDPAGLIEDNAEYQQWNVLMDVNGYDDRLGEVSQDESPEGLIEPVSLLELSEYIDTFLKVKSAIEFLIASFRSHYGNAKAMDKLFNSTGWLFSGKNGVDHYVVASVDLNLWVNAEVTKSKRNNSLIQQYALIEKTSLIMKGKIFPFVGFDPLRELLQRTGHQHIKESPLQLVKDCILKHGFVGIKLYPAMGYAPYGNSEYDDWPKFVRHIDMLGEKLDQIMLELFEFCVSENVPVMAHANISMHTRPDYWKRGSANAWRKLLEYKDASGNARFEKLRVNLGHGGGLERMSSGDSDWVKGLFQLAYEFENVHIDFSNFEGIDESDFRKGLVREMKKLSSRQVQKIMYGSDWYMIAKYPNKHNYLGFMLEIANSLEDTKAEGFMGKNCLRFLGLDEPASKSSKRIEEFYGNHGIDIRKHLFV